VYWREHGILVPQCGSTVTVSSRWSVQCVTLVVIQLKEMAKRPRVGLGVRNSRMSHETCQRDWACQINWRVESRIVPEACSRGKGAPPPRPETVTSSC